MQEEAGNYKDVIEKLLKEPAVVLVIGNVDTGKTTFVYNLAKEAYNKKYKVAIVDADVGQSEIGPPTTIGMGLVEDDSLNIKVCSLYFVGDISPAECIMEQVIGTKKLIDIAKKMYAAEFIITDTTGLVHGEVGRRLKSYKIELIEPDYVVALAYDKEINHIINSAPIDKKRIIKLKPSCEVKKKVEQIRRKKREDKFKEYFKDIKTVEFKLSDIKTSRTYLLNGKILDEKEVEYLSRSVDEIILHAEIINQNTLYIVVPDRIPQINLLRLNKKVIQQSADDFLNTLVALLDFNYKVLSIGLLKKIDFVKKSITIACPSITNEEEVKTIQFSNFKLEL